MMVERSEVPWWRDEKHERARAAYNAFWGKANKGELRGLEE